jgi:hypothetical protein
MGFTFIIYGSSIVFIAPHQYYYYFLAKYIHSIFIIPDAVLCEIIILLFNFFIIIIQVAIIGYHHPSWHDLITFHLITPFSLFLELLV